MLGMSRGDEPLSLQVFWSQVRVVAFDVYEALSTSAFKRTRPAEVEVFGVDVNSALFMVRPAECMTMGSTSCALLTTHAAVVLIWRGAV